MAKLEFTDTERAVFLELAVEIGITRAKRQLGYPASWNTAKRWVDGAGIEVPLDNIKAQANAHNEWYKTEEMLLVCQTGLSRAQEALENELLTPDEQKKLAEAVQKYTNTMLLLQNKATSITESRHKDNADLAIMELLNEEAARNNTIETGVEPS